MRDRHSRPPWRSYVTVAWVRAAIGSSLLEQHRERLPKSGGRMEYTIINFNVHNRHPSMGTLVHTLGLQNGLSNSLRNFRLGNFTRLCVHNVNQHQISLHSFLIANSGSYCNVNGAITERIYL